MALGLERDALTTTAIALSYDQLLDDRASAHHLEREGVFARVGGESRPVELVGERLTVDGHANGGEVRTRRVPRLEH